MNTDFIDCDICIISISKNEYLITFQFIGGPYNILKLMIPLFTLVAMHKLVIIVSSKKLNLSDR